MISLFIICYQEVPLRPTSQELERKRRNSSNIEDHYSSIKHARTGKSDLSKTKRDCAKSNYIITERQIKLYFYRTVRFSDSTSHGIDKKQWDDLVVLVHRLLEEHPTAQADRILAQRLGCSVSFHYNTWSEETINIAKPFLVKVAYLLNHWKQIENHTSMKAMIMNLDESLKAEISFNSMREKIKQRFL